MKEQKLPQMKKGEKLGIENVSMNTGKTKPPARFTEADTSCCNGESGAVYGKP